MKDHAREAHAMSDFQGLAEWDWVYSPVNRYRTLHAITEADWDTLDREWGGHAVMACGREGRVSIPGMFSRMGANRCRACCKAMGFPTGKGSPKNDDACRPLVEARLAAFAAPSDTPQIPS